MATPPEDSGGIGEFEEKLTALKDSSHPLHEDARDTLGVGFVRARFDLAAVNRELQALRPRTKRTTKSKA
jgi:hypothetical protein